MLSYTFQYGSLTVKLTTWFSWRGSGAFCSPCRNTTRKSTQAFLIISKKQQVPTRWSRSYYNFTINTENSYVVSPSKLLERRHLPLTQLHDWWSLPLELAKFDRDRQSWLYFWIYSSLNLLHVNGELRSCWEAPLSGKSSKWTSCICCVWIAGYWWVLQGRDWNTAPKILVTHQSSYKTTYECSSTWIPLPLYETTQFRTLHDGIQEQIRSLSTDTWSQDTANLWRRVSHQQLHRKQTKNFKD